MFNIGTSIAQQHQQQQSSFQQQLQSKTNSYPINSHMTMPVTTHHRAADLIANNINEKNTNNKPRHLSLNPKENKPEPNKPVPTKLSMDLPKSQAMSKKAARSTFSYKLISYIGADIEAKVDEHFRRSLGKRYNKTATSLPKTQAPYVRNYKGDNSTSDKNASEKVQNKTSDSYAHMNNGSNEQTSNLDAKCSGASSETKLLINELEQEEENEEAGANTAEEKNPQSKDWNNNNITANNINDYCDCSNYDCSHLKYSEASASTPSIPEQNPAISSKTSASGGFDENTVGDESQQYDDELNEYETDEHLIDYSNDEVLASNPVSPVSTASYSYSVISQTSDMTPEESASQAVVDASEQPVMDVMSSMLANKQIISSL